MTQFRNYFGTESFIARMNPGDGGGEPAKPNRVVPDPRKVWQGAFEEAEKKFRESPKDPERAESYNKAGQNYVDFLTKNPPKTPNGDALPLLQQDIVFIEQFYGWKYKYNKLKNPEEDFAWIGSDAQGQWNNAYGGRGNVVDGGEYADPSALLGDGVGRGVATPYQPISAPPEVGAQEVVQPKKDDVPAQRLGSESKASDPVRREFRRDIEQDIGLHPELWRKLNDAIDIIREKETPRIPLDNKNLIEGRGVVFAHLVRSTVNVNQGSNLTNLEKLNPNYLEDLAKAAVKGADAAEKTVDAQNQGMAFASTFRPKDANITVQKQLYYAGERIVHEVANNGIKVDRSKVTENIGNFIRTYQVGGEIIPLNLLTNSKNAKMLALCAEDPKTAAQALKAFKEVGGGLKAFSSEDLGKGMEVAMTAARQNAPENKKQAATNMVNLMMETASSKGITGNISFDKKKLEVISNGVQLKADKKAKGFVASFRDKVAFGEQAELKKDTETDKDIPVAGKDVSFRNFHPLDNLKAVGSAIRNIPNKNPVKMVANLVKLAVYDVPKLVVSAVIATPIAMVRAAVQNSADKKNDRLQEVAAYATKYPKLTAALKNAMKKDGIKPSNKNMIKAMEALKPLGRAGFENGTLGKVDLEKILNDKTRDTKGPSQLQNLLRGGMTNKLVTLAAEQNKAYKDNLKEASASRQAAGANPRGNHERAAAALEQGQAAGATLKQASSSKTEQAQHGQTIPTSTRSSDVQTRGNSAGMGVR